jgi:hypothetical protein
LPLHFTIVPQVKPVLDPTDLAPRTFANRSVFPRGTRIEADGTITLTRVINLSTFGHHRITTGADLDILPSRVVNTSTFPTGTEVSESPPDGAIEPSRVVNTSTFPTGTEVSASPADGALRPSRVVNTSTFPTGTVVTEDDDGGPIGISPIGSDPI